MRDAGFEPAQLAWEASILTTRSIPHKYVNESNTLLRLSCSDKCIIDCNVKQLEENYRHYLSDRSESTIKPYLVTVRKFTITAK